MRRILMLLAILVCVGCSSVEEEQAESESLLVVRLNRRLVEYNNLHSNPIGGMNEAQIMKARQVKEELHHLSSRNYITLVNIALGDNVEKQVVAIAALGFTQRQDAMRVLVELLKRDETMILEPALAALGMLRYEQTPVERVAELTRHDNPRIRRNALFALSTILREGNHRGALDHIHKATEDGDWYVRYQAYRAIARIGAAESESIVVDKGMADDRVEVKLQAIACLAYIPGESFYETLVETLKDRNTMVVQTAAAVLREVTGNEFGSSFSAWNSWLIEYRAKQQTQEKSGEQE
jgi:hypothetical protein